METKVCKKCGRELPVENFSINRSNKDGLQTECKECKAEYMKGYWLRRKAEKKRIEEDIKEFEKKHKVYTNRDLAKFTPRELMLELKARGYEGELLFREVKVTEHRINIGKLE
jgi:NAD-dependent SIR2 family protein deacetylase